MGVRPEEQEHMAPGEDMLTPAVDPMDPFAAELAFTEAYPAPRILANLDRLYRTGARIVVRCPLVPGVNDDDEHLRGIADLDARHPDLEGIEVMPYHALGRDKAARVGLADELARLPSADPATIEGWLAELRRLGCRRVRLG
jgi:pyruvate formate lyase activating enzyme